MWRKVCSGSILFYLCLGYMNIQSTLYSSVLCYFRLTMLTIGLSGATCAGKSSVASMLEKVLTSCMVINQDTYYYEEGSDKHVKDPVTHMINWEVLEAFNMGKMHNDLSLFVNT